MAMNYGAIDKTTVQQFC